jgi:hypothetical protein
LENECKFSPHFRRRRVRGFHWGVLFAVPHAKTTVTIRRGKIFTTCGITLEKTGEELMRVRHGVFPDGRIVQKLAVFHEA